MLVVDTSVVIDRLRDRRTPQTSELDRRIAREPVLLADLVLMEVLQGAQSDTHARRVIELLRMFRWTEIVGDELVIEAAKSFRTLRSAGITLRSQVDLLIGTYCIRHGHELLHADRDYDHMARHLDLRVARASSPPH